MFMETSVIIKLMIYYLIWISRWILEDVRVHMHVRRVADERICKAIVWIRKFHFIFLNLVILDTFFYGSHALLHYNTKERNLQYLLTLFNLVFQTFDLLELVKVAFSINNMVLVKTLLKKFNPEKAISEKHLIPKIQKTDKLDLSVNTSLNSTRILPKVADKSTDDMGL